MAQYFQAQCVRQCTSDIIIQPSDIFYVEEYVISPLGCFFVEDISSGEIWMVLILPKMKNDLNKLKREGRLDEDNIKAVMAQLFKVMQYLTLVRGITH